MNLSHFTFISPFTCVFSIKTTLGSFKHGNVYANVNIFVLARIGLLCCWISAVVVDYYCKKKNK